MPDPTFDLLSNLRFRSAWIKICEHYLKLRPKPDAEALIRGMLETEHEAVNLLSLALRQQNTPPNRAGVDNRLISQAKYRRTTEERLRFMERGLTTSQKWYQEQLADPDDPNHELWQELADRQTAFMAKHAALIDQLAAASRRIAAEANAQ